MQIRWRGEKRFGGFARFPVPAPRGVLRLPPATTTTTTAKLLHGAQ